MMRQKIVNKIRDKAFRAASEVSCRQILEDAGYPTRKRGNQIYSFCPFCQTKDRTGGMDKFSVTEGLNKYHCFACDAGGGSAKLYAELNNCSFWDGVLSLGFRSGGITVEEYESAISSIDAKNKLSRSTKAFEKKDTVSAEEENFKAPPEICDMVYRAMLRLSEFALRPEHREYLKTSRHLSDDEIDEIGFFSYTRPFMIDRLVSNIQRLNPGFSYNSFLGVPGFYFEYASKEKNLGRWYFKKPMPDAIGIPLKNYDGKIVALQMRNMKSNNSQKYYYVSSRGVAQGTNRAFGSSPGSPVAVIYPKELTHPVFYIGEGFFKMNEISKENVVAFSVQGVNAIHYVPDEIRAVMNGSKIQSVAKGLSGTQYVKLVIVFDADMFSKIQVLEAGCKAAVMFEQQFPGKEIYFLVWNEKFGKGFDDMKFYCQSNNLDYRHLTRAIPKDAFLDMSKKSIFEADNLYSQRSGKKIDIKNRKDKEYGPCLHDACMKYFSFP